MLHYLIRLMAICLFSITSTLTLANPNDAILGYWRTIDDATGFAKAIVIVQKAQNGSYLGTIVATVERPDYTPAEKCQNCPAPFTDRKIIGLPILWNLQPSDKLGRSNEKRYVGGYVIDPLNGKFYQGEARVSRDGRRLTMRGHIIGVPFLGRTQTWLRETDYKPKS